MTDSAAADIKRQIRAALEAVHALAQAIQAVGEIPEGELYARCGCPSMGIFQPAMDILERAGLISRKGHLVRWIPTQPKEADEKVPSN